MAKRGRIEINCADDLLLIMEDMFEEFLESMFDNEKYTEPVPDEHRLSFKEEGITRVWDYSAQCLIDRYKKRMKSLFEKYFPDNSFNLESHYYREF